MTWPGHAPFDLASPPLMLEFRVLGALDLQSAEGVEIRSVLAQPKRVALLAYLVLQLPGGYVRRDTLVALFWPESDTEHARTALRKALHFLRRSLGDEVILTRGDGEMGVNLERLRCDAVEFTRALEEGQAAQALELYRGDLLTGLYASGAPEFEQWLESRRDALREQAAEAAWTLAAGAEAAGETPRVAGLARRAVALSREDEPAVRRLITLLGRLGDREGALRAYEELAERLAREFAVEPSPETQEAVELVRSAALPAAPAPPAAPATAATAVPHAAAPGNDARGDGGRGRGGPGVAISPRKSVAVLPFVNLSGSREHEYFSDGMTEELIALLGRIRELRVISRTSVMQYKDARKSVREIAQELGVGTVLEGSVRHAEKRVRIAAQLIDVAADAPIWAEKYDRTLDDIFAIQEDVARRIASALHAELTAFESARIERRPTANIEAYDLYLRGRHLWNQRTPDAMRQSVEYLTRALTLDSDFALAAAALADAYLTLGIYGLQSPQQVMERARTAAGRALSLDGSLAEALTARACVLAMYDWEWKAAERDFLRAIELNPRYAIAHQWYAMHLLAPLGRLAEAHQALDRATALDPLSPSIHASRGVLFYFERRYEEAAVELHRLLDVHPGFGLAVYFLGLVRAAQERHAEAVELLRRAVALTGNGTETTALLGYALAASGREAEAEDLVRALIERSRESYVSPSFLAQLYLGVGDRERALAALHEACEVRAVDLVWMAVRPVFDPLRADPRFTAMLGRAGLR